MISAKRHLLAGASRLLAFHKRHPPVGARPGTLVLSPEAAPPVIRVIHYTVDGVAEAEMSDVEQLAAYRDREGVAWIDVQGLGDEQVLRRIGELFDIHPLALEDAVNIPQRPKSEGYDHQHLLVTRMAKVAQGQEFDVEQVSLFIGRSYLLTLQERSGDVFDPVRRRIHAGKGLMRRSGPDYLAYALLDLIIDGYYPMIETVGDRLQELEEGILTQPRAAELREIHRVRRELLALRRAVWPQREAVASLIRDEAPFVTETVRQYLRDCHDHVIQLADVIETYRELTNGLMEMYQSQMSQRTNEVMKVLTIMASIFIPLTFLVGVYGMNFEYIPELKVHWAYPALLSVMVVIAVAMLLYFRHRGWLGNGPDGPSAGSGAS